MDRMRHGNFRGNNRRPAPYHRNSAGNSFNRKESAPNPDNINYYSGMESPLEVDYDAQSTDISVFVLGIPVFKTPDELHDMFSDCGKVNFIKIWPPKKPEHNRTMALVYFANSVAARKCLANMNQKEPFFPQR